MTTLVVVPTYNEAETVRTVIDRVDALGFELLIVDDGSPDGTAELVEHASIAQPSVHLLRRTSKDGLGSAYRAGFSWALDRGWYDVVCQMDADLSHDPLDLVELVAAVDDGADVAIGSRYVPGGSTPGWSRSRRWLSRGGNAYMRLVTGVRVNDMTAGFRAWRIGALDELHLCQTESEGYSFQLETTALAWAQDKRVTEVPIVFSDRAEGESKMSRAIVLEALWRVLVLGWRIRRPGSEMKLPAARQQRVLGEQRSPHVAAAAAGDDGPELIIDLRDGSVAPGTPAAEKTRQPVGARSDERA